MTLFRFQELESVGFNSSVSLGRPFERAASYRKITGTAMF
jgi:hypothetical protein